VEKLADDLRRLRSDFQEYELKYLNLHAKAKSLFGKIAKENARAEEKEDAAEVDAGQAPAIGTSLSPRARLIQQQILARRAAQGGDRG
jgi:hypothetical protein